MSSESEERVLEDAPRSAERQLDSPPAAGEERVAEPPTEPTLEQCAPELLSLAGAALLD